ncbi:hypothetical protein K7W42_12665 [Deinococcus sp. HMF7604]|uniref:hypothetical protein n=1 Tax=Deinococcus betulae TaxID=2873312 RepID=UPI001CCB3B4E|nr:hypothetical protein [Deinococcus betulae]MBZ9751715.1 hypothetical protein [Deinococcus betulae]
MSVSAGLTRVLLIEPKGVDAALFRQMLQQVAPQVELTHVTSLADWPPHDPAQVVLVNAWLLGDAGWPAWRQGFQGPLFGWGQDLTAVHRDQAAAARMTLLAKPDQFNSMRTFVQDFLTRSGLKA